MFRYDYRDSIVVSYSIFSSSALNRNNKSISSTIMEGSFPHPMYLVASWSLVSSRRLLRNWLDNICLFLGNGSQRNRTGCKSEPAEPVDRNLAFRCTVRIWKHCGNTVWSIPVVRRNGTVVVEIEFFKRSGKFVPGTKMYVREISWTNSENILIRKKN